MNQNFLVPESEVRDRISRIQNALKETEIGGMLIVQRVDLFYFSGTAQNSVLYIPLEVPAKVFIC